MMKGLISEVLKEVIKYNRDEVRIVMVGDIFQQKIKASNEAKTMFHEMLNVFNSIAKTIIVAGNHDMLENNTDRKDSISPTFEIKDVYSNVTYADKVLSYKSGYIIDDNIVWVVYSMFDKFNRPNIEGCDTIDKKVIGLYHGDIVGATTDLGRMSENGINPDSFNGCDCVMAGHIHKFQEIRKNGIPIVYSSSVFQQNSGENISNHGFVVWDIESMSYTFHEVPNNYNIYRFEITSYDDVKDDIERLINL